MPWRLSILAIHQSGIERWMQVSASCGPVGHDLILHMPETARGSDAYAAIESWLADPAPASRVIHVG